MDARFVGEGVGADDGFVGLHHETGDGGNQTRGLGNVAGVYAGGVGHGVLAGLERHDDLLHGGVAGTLAEAVDGAFHLARTGPHRGQGIGHRQPEVIVAVHRKYRLVDVGHAVDEHLDDGGELSG